MTQLQRAVVVREEHLQKQQEHHEKEGNPEIAGFVAGQIKEFQKLRKQIDERLDKQLGRAERKHQKLAKLGIYAKPQ